MSVSLEGKSEETRRALKDLQEQMKKKAQTKEDFSDDVEDHEDDDEDGSDSHEEKPSLIIQCMDSKLNGPKKGRQNNNDLLHTLLLQHELDTDQFRKLERKIYKLKNENDRLENKGRYLQLDFNNLQLTLEEEKKKTECQTVSKGKTYMFITISTLALILSLIFNINLGLRYLFHMC